MSAKESQEFPRMSAKESQSQDRLFNSIHQTPATAIIKTDQPLNNTWKRIEYSNPSSSTTNPLLTKLYTIRDHLCLINSNNSQDLEIFLIDCLIRDLESSTESFDRPSRLEHEGLAEMIVKWDEKTMESLEETSLASFLVSNIFGWTWSCIHVLKGQESERVVKLRSLVLRLPCEIDERSLDVFEGFGFKIWNKYGKSRNARITRPEYDEIVGLLEKTLDGRFFIHHLDSCPTELSHVDILVEMSSESDSYDDIESRILNNLDIDGISLFF
jgi:hypothetical protein